MEKTGKKNKLINGEIIVAALIVVFGVIWTVSGFSTGLWDRVTLGGGFILAFVGIPLIILCSVVLLQQLKKAKSGEEDKNSLTEKESKTVFMMAVLSAAAALLMNYLLGTMVTLITFLILWFRLLAKFQWKKTLLITLCVMAVIYAVFVIWLNVSFPTFLDLRII